MPSTFINLCALMWARSPVSSYVYASEADCLVRGTESLADPPMRTDRNQNFISPDRKIFFGFAPPPPPTPVEKQIPGWNLCKVAKLLTTIANSEHPLSGHLPTAATEATPRPTAVCWYPSVFGGPGKACSLLCHEWPGIWVSGGVAVRPRRDPPAVRVAGPGEHMERPSTGPRAAPPGPGP